MSDQSSLHQDKSPPKRNTDPDFVPEHLHDTPGSAPDEAGGWVAPEAPKAALKILYVGPDWTPEQKYLWRAQGDFKAEHGHWPEDHHIEFFKEEDRWPKKSEMEPWSYWPQDKEGWHNGSRAWQPSRGSAWKPQFEASNQGQDASGPRSEASSPLEAAVSTVPQAAESHEQATNEYCVSGCKVPCASQYCLSIPAESDPGVEQNRPHLVAESPTCGTCRR